MPQDSGDGDADGDDILLASSSFSSDNVMLAQPTTTTSGNNNDSSQNFVRESNHTAADENEDDDGTCDDGSKKAGKKRSCIKDEATTNGRSRLLQRGEEPFDRVLKRTSSSHVVAHQQEGARQQIMKQRLIETSSRQEQQQQVFRPLEIEFSNGMRVVCDASTGTLRDLATAFHIPSSACFSVCVKAVPTDTTDVIASTSTSTSARTSGSAGAGAGPHLCVNPTVSGSTNVTVTLFDLDSLLSNLFIRYGQTDASGVGRVLRIKIDSLMHPGMRLRDDLPDPTVSWSQFEKITKAACDKLSAARFTPRTLTDIAIRDGHVGLRRLLLETLKMEIGHVELICLYYFPVR